MSSHLVFPYAWEFCLNVDECKRIVHLDIDSDLLNTSPREWVDAFLMSKYTLEANVFSWQDNDGRTHNEHGPALECSDGKREWYFHGERHRLDGPAVETAGGRKEWFRNGERHRENGPAVENINGTCEWWANGERHREDGPAVERANGGREWWWNNLRHRVDGPAVEFPDGTKEWWEYNEFLSSSQR